MDKGGTNGVKISGLLERARTLRRDTGRLVRRLRKTSEEICALEGTQSPGKNSKELPSRAGKFPTSAG
jgi:hypothetical protein